MQEKLNKIKDHFNVIFTDEWEQNLDWYIYNESTADGYEVYISHDSKSPMCINDNVLYYDNDLADELGYKVIEDDIFEIYVDDMNSYWFEEAINNLINVKEKEISK